MLTLSFLMMATFLLLDTFQATSKPTSLGASEHPDKRVCQFGLLILAASQSSDALLDHIADYLQFISNAKSIWLLLNTSYNHERTQKTTRLCHLLSRRPRYLVVPAGCCIAFCRPLIVPPSCHLVTQAGCRIASHCPLVAPPSRPLVVPAFCHIASPRLLVASPTRPLSVSTGCCVAS